MLFRVVVCLLVGLSECVVVSLTCLVVSITSKVGLRFLLFLNLNGHALDLKKGLVGSFTYLVILHSDLDLEVVGHDELVSFDAVKVVLLLVLLLVDLVVLLHLLLNLQLIGVHLV